MALALSILLLFQRAALKDPGEGGLTFEKGRDVLTGARDPYPFPDTIETPFQTKVRRTHTPL